MENEEMGTDFALHQLPERVEGNGHSNGDGRLRAADLLAPRKTLENLLLEMNLLTAGEMDAALSLQASSGKQLREVLVEQGLISAEDLTMVISLQSGVPFIDLKRHRVDPRAVESIPEAMARQYNAIPLEVVDNSLVTVMEDPEDIQALQDLAAQSRKRIEPAIGVLEDILKAIDLNYRASGEIQRQVSQINVLDTSDDQLSADLVAQAPVVRAVDLLITQAVKDRASDIHIEPQENRLRIRYRIDGVLHEMMTLPMSVHPALVSRLKILANMNIAERRRPQDGQFDVTVGDREVDMRVATIDTVYGEKMEMRVLDRSMAIYSLTELGLRASSLDKYRKMLRTPYGMILVSGPTGSGKTTTLYTSINSLEHNEQSIVTIEDPVEYR
ncbi:MAG: Flp pilus assembly complex ATPase component TadA, partial [Chloroflexi bacterium]|nr:Flp pilus assembly complex ATPase component TadA [Chloroflexota bacterium]